MIRDTAGLALKQEPVIAPLREKKIVISKSSSQWILAELVKGDQRPIRAGIEIQRSIDGCLRSQTLFRRSSLDRSRVDPEMKEFYIDRTNSGSEVSPEFPARTAAPLVSERRYHLDLIVDRSSIEAFAQEGTIAMTDLIYAPSSGTSIRSFAKGTTQQKVSGVFWRLKSIWEQDASGKTGDPGTSKNENR